MGYDGGPSPMGLMGFAPFDPLGGSQLGPPTPLGAGMPPTPLGSQMPPTPLGGSLPPTPFGGSLRSPTPLSRAQFGGDYAAQFEPDFAAGDFAPPARRSLHAPGALVDGP